VKKLKVIVAPDSFKECLSASQVAWAIARGVRRASPRCVIDEIPLADGGEGTVEVVREASGGRSYRATVQGPMGGPVKARYAVVGSGDTAVVEMAAASGLHLVKPKKRDPLRATTYGTGELILKAARRGVKRIIVGLGGSATVDGGAGMAQAIGVRLLDGRGRELKRGGGALKSLRAVDVSGRDPALDGVEILGACDVRNPLCGRTGAALVYGPQKGATPSQAVRLDGYLRNMAKVVRRDVGVKVLDMPGAGAAGGLGAGLAAFAGATLGSGVELVLDAVDFRKRIRGASLIITGEGRLDRQSAYGKVVAGVAAEGRKRRIPVIVLAGTLGPDFREIYSWGVTAAFALTRGGGDSTGAMARAPALLADLAEAVLRQRVSC